MLSIEHFISSSEDEENENKKKMLRFNRKTLRTKANLFELPDTKFMQYFRVTKESFGVILRQVEAKLSSKRASSISPSIKLATALRIFAEGGYQHGVGNDFNLGLAQPTVCNIFKEVCNVLETELSPKWISWITSEQEKEEAKLFFFERGFPGVIGCVDGTHVSIITPDKEQQHMFLNRKGFYSLNGMIVCDHKMRIRVVDARFPGSCHDAHIWNLSSIRRMMRDKYENGERRTWLLGDAGYPLEPYIITPFRSAVSGSSECLFNSKHARARNIVERTIGVLKNRFRCLLGARQLHYSPEKAKQIVNICAALHNICINDGVQLPIEFEEEKINSTHEESSENQTAINIRNEILDNFVLV